MNIKFDLGKKNGKVNDIKADELDEKFDDEEKDIVRFGKNGTFWNKK